MSDDCVCVCAAAPDARQSNLLFHLLSIPLCHFPIHPWRRRQKKSGRGRRRSEKKVGSSPCSDIRSNSRRCSFGGGTGRETEEGGGVEEQEVRAGEERKKGVCVAGKERRRSAYSIARCLSAVTEERSKRGATNFLCLLPPPPFFHLFLFR